jgi:hypothetical protein
MLRCKRWYIELVNSVYTILQVQRNQCTEAVPLKLGLQRRRILVHLRFFKSLEHLSDGYIEDRLISRTTFSYQLIV